ncbi:MAG: DUF4238 domain-containing protein [Acidobacteriota bacterium]
MQQITKNDHLVPRTYLRPWCYSNDSLYVLDKATRKIGNKNINNNFNLKHYHTITAGMPICNDCDLKSIFQCLESYDIYYGDKRLEALREYNNYYSVFDEWIILKNGVRIPKKERNGIKSAISAVKITEIEDLWAKKYEDKWPNLRETIEKEIMSASNTIIQEFYKGLLMKFVVAMHWRGFEGNDSFNKVYEFISNTIELDKVDIPLNKRQRLYLETAAEEQRHYLLLQNYRDFLNDRGHMYEMAKHYIRWLTIRFLVAKGRLSFLTSDNPSYLSNTSGGIVHVMPVNPKILITIGKNVDNVNQYVIKTVLDSEVKNINKDILSNCVDRVISIDTASIPTYQ